MLQALQELKAGDKVKIQSGEACYVEIVFEKVVLDKTCENFDSIVYGSRIIKKVDGKGQPTGRLAQIPFRLRVSKINSIELSDSRKDIAADNIEEKNLIIIPSESLQG